MRCLQNCHRPNEFLSSSDSVICRYTDFRKQSTYPELNTECTERLANHYDKTSLTITYSNIELRNYTNKINERLFMLAESRLVSPAVF